MKAWEAARATSAAPSYFAPFKHRKNFNKVGFLRAGEHVLVDGGIYANNPTKVALQEAEAIWPGRPVSLVLSLGTG